VQNCACVRERGRLAAHVERNGPFPSAPATETKQASLDDACTVCERVQSRFFVDAFGRRRGRVR
jgi:hypothetical protein